MLQGIDEGDANMQKADPVGSAFVVVESWGISLPRDKRGLQISLF